VKRAILVVVVLAAAAAVVWGVRGGRGQETVNYRLVTVERGDVESVVSSTGTLEPVTTVRVGTQVSGIVDRIYVDFNDPVRAGQVIARIDTTLLANAVAAAEAQRERSEAELRQAEREYARLSALFREGMVSESEYSGAQYALDLARAAVHADRVSLTRAEQNLSYAIITSPIAGTVVSRAVDRGQTVQASFSAPELFLIAGDLGQMQILAAVDESDVGEISEGQTVRFTVQAYPDDTFRGTVRQLRLQGATTENVVSYTAVIDVANPDHRLLPGMTATVDFLVETATDVLHVANAALRFRPDQAVMQAALERKRAEHEAQRGEPGGARPDSTGGPRRPQGGGGVPGGNPVGEQVASDRGMLWTVGPDGRLDVVFVRTGISDGTSTVVKGRDLAEGQQVIAGVASAAAAEASASPFQQQRQQPGPPRPGGF